MNKFLALGALLIGSQAMATPGVITVTGTITNAPNPNGHCGASEFGYIFSSSFKDSAGADQRIEDCLESVAVPLDASECLKPKKSADILKQARAILKNASGLPNAKIDIALGNMEDPTADGFTILGIHSDCKK